ncbi:hypothetical protein [Pseudidiomarina salilacus]|uniref:hypothetical protein n=1 Tax=Pseudidiomarina salilacus TaxID=3384452 RepID=UPI003984797E
MTIIESKSEIKITDNFSERLHHAMKVIDEMKGVKRLDEDDREAFARNLGRMFTELNKHTNEDNQLNFAKLFDAAFNNRNVSLSLQKKRKTLILLDNESTNSQGLASGPHKYIDLAQALDDLMSKYLGTASGYGFLRLIENSSFDLTESENTRAEQEQRADIQKALTKCVEKVTNSVDLRWMYNWLERTPVNTKGGTGKVMPITHLRYSEGLRGLLRIDYNELFNNGIAPCVRLLSKTTQMVPELVFSLRCADEAPSRESMIKTVQQFVSTAPKLNLPRLDLFAGSSKHRVADVFEALQDQLIAHNLILDRSLLGIDIQKYIDLEVLLHTESNTWMPFLLERYDISRNDSWYDEHHCVETLSVADTTIYFLGYLLDDMQYALCAYHYEDSDGQSHYCYFFNDNVAQELDFTWVISLPFVPFSDDYLDFVCEELKLDEDWRYFPEFTVPTGHVIKQKPQSLAYYLMANLLYAEGDENIANRLVRDAQEKYQLLRHFADHQEAQYASQFEKFLQS